MNIHQDDLHGASSVRKALDEFPISSERDSDDITERLEQAVRVNDAFPGLKAQEPTAILIDVNNLYKLCEEEGFRLDYIKLKWLLSRRCDLRYARMFCAIDPNDRGAQAWLRNMEEDGFTVVTKPISRYRDHKEDRIVTKGNMDIILTLAATKLSPSFGHVIIGSCDGDFAELVDDLKADGARSVSVMGVMGEGRNGMSDALIASADNFYNLAQIKDIISFRDVKDDPDHTGG